MKKILYSLLLMLFLGACSANLETKEIETPTMELLAEGPLFEGANTATATWEFDLSELLGGDESKISKAKVTSIEVMLQESDDLPALEKMVLEMTSKNTSMIRLGLHEGEFQAKEWIGLNVADKQENLAKAFEDGRITFVGDFDLLDDEFWGNVQFQLRVKFELGIK